MSIVDWIQRNWRKEAVHYVVTEIPPDHVRPTVQPLELQAEKHYLRVWLSEMFLAEDRRLFREYVPVVHSSIRLTYGSRSRELPYVAGPHSLNLGSTLGRGVQIDHRLTNLLPFRGGSLDLTTALVAYKERDYFSGLVETLHDFTALLNVGQLGTALKVIDGAVDGAHSLLGAGEKDVHLLFYRGHGGSSASGGMPLKAGYTAVIRADAGKFDSGSLYVRDSQLLVGSNANSAKPLVGHDYMLLRIEATTGRDDFHSFEEFEQILAQAIADGTSDRQRGDSVMHAMKGVVWRSTDLTMTDRVRVVTALQNTYELALRSGQDDGGAVAASGRGPERHSERLAQLVSGPAIASAIRAVDLKSAELVASSLSAGASDARFADFLSTVAAFRDPSTTKGRGLGQQRQRTSVATAKARRGRRPHDDT